MIKIFLVLLNIVEAAKAYSSSSESDKEVEQNSDKCDNLPPEQQLALLRQELKEAKEEEKEIQKKIEESLKKELELKERERELTRQFKKLAVENNQIKRYVLKKRIAIKKEKRTNKNVLFPKKPEFLTSSIT